MLNERRFQFGLKDLLQGLQSFDQDLHAYLSLVVSSDTVDIHRLIKPMYQAGAIEYEKAP